MNLDLSRLKIGMGTQLVRRKELKRYGQNILECAKPCRVTRKYMENNEKVCDTLDAKDNLL